MTGQLSTAFDPAEPLRNSCSTRATSPRHPLSVLVWQCHRRAAVPVSLAIGGDSGHAIAKVIGRSS